MGEAPAKSKARFGTLGRVLIADLGTRQSRVEPLDESVYQRFLGGYGLGAWLMWKHFPAGTDRARARGLLRDLSRACSPARAPRSRVASRSSASRR